MPSKKKPEVGKLSTKGTGPKQVPVKPAVIEHAGEDEHEDDQDLRLSLRLSRSRSSSPASSECSSRSITPPPPTPSGSGTRKNNPFASPTRNSPRLEEKRRRDLSLNSPARKSPGSGEKCRRDVPFASPTRKSPRIEERRRREEADHRCVKYNSAKI